VHKEGLVFTKKKKKRKKLNPLKERKKERIRKRPPNGSAYEIAIHIFTNHFLHSQDKRYSLLWFVYYHP